MLDIAHTEQRTLGVVVSALARRGLRLRRRNGVPLLPLQPSAHVGTPALVRELDEERP